MFKLFRKSPLQRLQKEYALRLEQARNLQRGGDIKGFAAMSAQAEDLLKKIEEIEKQKAEDSQS